MRQLIHTLLTSQRKLFSTGMTALAICGGFLLAIYRPQADALGLYRVFTEALLFALGIFVAGNSSVYLWQHKFGPGSGPPKESKP